MSVAAIGRELCALLERQQSFKAASDVARETALAADRTGRSDDAVAAAMDAIRIIDISSATHRRAWDWMLLSQMAGLAVKNHMAAGRLATAGFMQEEAMEACCWRADVPARPS